VIGLGPKFWNRLGQPPQGLENFLPKFQFLYLWVKKISTGWVKKNLGQSQFGPLFTASLSWTWSWSISYEKSCLCEISHSKLQSFNSTSFYVGLLNIKVGWLNIFTVISLWRSNRKIGMRGIFATLCWENLNTLESSLYKNDYLINSNKKNSKDTLRYNSNRDQRIVKMLFVLLNWKSFLYLQ